MASCYLLRLPDRNTPSQVIDNPYKLGGCIAPQVFVAASHDVWHAIPTTHELRPRKSWWSGIIHDQLHEWQQVTPNVGVIVKITTLPCTFHVWGITQTVKKQAVIVPGHHDIPAVPI